MIIQHAGKRPKIDPTAWIAPDATVCGDVTIGPGARVLYGARIIAENGGTIRIGRDCIVTAAVAIFHGARLGRGSEARPHATVHLRTNLPPQGLVPIGWIAVGDPAQILPPDKHDEIWAVQKPLSFLEWVYGLARETPELMRKITQRLSESLGAHAADELIDP